MSAEEADRLRAANEGELIRRAAEGLHALANPGDEVSRPRKDMHALTQQLGQAEDLLLSGIGQPDRREGLRIARQACDALERVPAWRLPDDATRMDLLDELALVERAVGRR